AETPPRNETTDRSTGCAAAFTAADRMRSPKPRAASPAGFAETLRAAAGCTVLVVMEFTAAGMDVVDWIIAGPRPETCRFAGRRRGLRHIRDGSATVGAGVRIHPHRLAALRHEAA